MRYIGWFLLAALFIVAATFFFGGLGLFTTKTFGVASQNARREVFEQSQSYVEGKRQDLIRWKLQYETADSLGKKALKYTILTSMANVDKSKFEPSLRSFIDGL